MNLENLLHAANGSEFNAVLQAANHIRSGKPDCTLASATSLSVSEKRLFHGNPTQAFLIGTSAPSLTIQKTCSPHPSMVYAAC
jgi:hypothetical protein